MIDIHVRITDSQGRLVREFSTNSPEFADEHIQIWRDRFAKCEPDETLDVERTDTGEVASGWWRVCPGCGCERQLDRAAAAGGREQMAAHQRLDRDRRVMVLCGGSGQPPAGDASSGGGRGEGDAA